MVAYGTCFYLIQRLQMGKVKVFGAVTLCPLASPVLHVQSIRPLLQSLIPVLEKWWCWRMNTKCSLVGRGPTQIQAFLPLAKYCQTVIIYWCCLCSSASQGNGEEWNPPLYRNDFTEAAISGHYWHFIDYSTFPFWRILRQNDSCVF